MGGDYGLSKYQARAGESPSRNFSLPRHDVNEDDFTKGQDWGLEHDSAHYEGAKHIGGDKTASQDPQDYAPYDGAPYMDHEQNYEHHLGASTLQKMKNAIKRRMKRATTSHMRPGTILLTRKKNSRAS